MKIIYPQSSGEIAILFPVATDMTIEQIAQKDVPNGAPYLIVEDGGMPADWSTSAAWEADFSNPDGIGMGPQRYFIAQADAAIVEILARVEPEEPALKTAIPFEQVVFGGEPADEEKQAFYADYVAGIAAENKNLKSAHQKQLIAFRAQQDRDRDTQLALIAQMKAEVLKLEGVAL